MPRVIPETSTPKKLACFINRINDGSYMLPSTFLRINDQIYNANLIKSISIDDECAECQMSIHGPIVRIIIIFWPIADVSVKRFYTYWSDIGQILYDWQHVKSSFFEIPYLERDDVIKMNEEWLKKEKEEFEDMIENGEDSRTSSCK